MNVQKKRANRVPLIGMIESRRVRLLEDEDLGTDKYGRSVHKFGKHVYKIEPMTVGGFDKPTKTVYSMVHNNEGSNHGWEVGKFTSREGALAVAKLHAEHHHTYE
jgi:hypothetical protein